MYYKESDIQWYINYYLSKGQIISEDDAIAIIEFNDEKNRLNNDLDYECNDEYYEDDIL